MAGPDTPADETAVERPARPVAVELAAAVLIIGGMVGLIERLAAAPDFADRPGVGIGLALSTLLDLVLIVVGLLVRSGRGWVAAINVLAVATFVYLTAGLNPVALFFAAVYGAVFALVFANRPWFDQLRAWRGTRATRATVRR
jgi:hypothetical protein